MLYLPEEILNEEGYYSEYINGFRFIYDSTGRVVDSEVGVKWEDGTGHFVNRDGIPIDVVVEGQDVDKHIRGGNSRGELLDLPDEELNSLGYYAYQINGKKMIIDSSTGLIVAGALIEENAN